MSEEPHGSDPLERQTRSLCRFCAALCGVVVTSRGDQVTKVSGDLEHPISKGYTCAKGRALGAWHHHPDRLHRPRMRNGAAPQLAVGWDECLADLAQKLGQIIEVHGPDAVGVYNGTAGLMDGGAGLWRALFSALGSRSIYTTISVDAAAVLLVQELVSGNPLLAGQPDPDAELVILVGMNPMVSHGQNFGMTAPKIQLRKWAARGQLWVVDPRRTETAEVANRHLTPVPGSEWVLLGHLVREILKEGADHAFLAECVAGIDELAIAVERFDLDAVVRVTGVDAGAVQELLAAIRKTGRIGIMSGTGVSMARTANLTLMLSYALLAVTGSLDRPGGEWFNPGFVRNADATGWPIVDYTGPGAPSRPDIPSRIGEYSCGILADEIEAGNLKALLVLGGNPIIALPETQRLRRALDSLEVLAVVDVVETEVVNRATHVLPSVGQLERADLPFIDFLSPHQYVQYTAAVVPPHAEARPIWWIIAQLGRRLGYDLLSGADPDALQDDDILRPLASLAKASFDEIKAAPAGLGIDDRPWGWVQAHLPGGRWRVAPHSLLRQLNDTPMESHPSGRLLLIPARQKLKLNSQLADGLAAVRQKDGPTVSLHPTDARDRGLSNGDDVQIRSDHGEVQASVLIDPRMTPGVATFPHGFEVRNVGFLTSAKEIDRLSGMVVQSGIPVEVRKA